MLHLKKMSWQRERSLSTILWFTFFTSFIMGIYTSSDRRFTVCEILLTSYRNIFEANQCAVSSVTGSGRSVMIGRSAGLKSPGIIPLNGPSFLRVGK